MLLQQAGRLTLSMHDSFSVTMTTADPAPSLLQHSLITGGLPNSEAATNPEVMLNLVSSKEQKQSRLVSQHLGKPDLQTT